MSENPIPEHKVAEESGPETKTAAKDELIKAVLAEEEAVHDLNRIEDAEQEHRNEDNHKLVLPEGILRVEIRVIQLPPG